MSWVNYHSHSYYCDGKAAPVDFIKAAVDKGFHAYGFSSHAPVPFSSRWNMAIEKLPDYLDEVSSIRKNFEGSAEVYAGLEVDYIEGAWGLDSLGLNGHDLDYTIGSVHYIGKFPDGSYLCFDGGQPEIFFNGVKELFQNDYRKAVTAYYHAEIKMVENDRPDIIGHMDKIKMHNFPRPYLDEEDNWYINLVEETLEVIRQKGCIVEVNTRGLYKHNPPLLYPGEWVLKLIHQKKIPVMINSDAHHPSEVDSGFEQAARLLVQTGFRTLRILHKNRWQDVPFSENGLEI
jgi:histidinol-phosphatase (PHP family)